MLGRLNHVAIAVKDAAKAAKIYGAAFGAEISAAVPLPEHGVITVFVTLPNTKIEFIQPLGEASPIAKFVERNADGGIHHICYDVPDIIAELPAGRLYKDGNILEDAKSRAVVERRRMGFAGCAFVALAMTDKGELADDPEVDLVGIPEKNTAGEVIDEIVFDVVVSTVESLPRARRRDPDAMAESVRRAVRAVINEHWGKKPICLVHVLTV